jgi:hypothetical protein
MRRIPTIAFLVACAVGAARAQTFHACLEYDGSYYDMTSSASGTMLDEYQGNTFVNRETYAAFNLPAAGTTNWDEGVAFAATMQTRNSWLNNEPTSAATWVHDVNSDTWTWFTTVNGVPNQFEFATAKCRAATQSPAPTEGTTYRGCTSYNGFFYDLRSDPSGTTLNRFQGDALVNSQTYAAFHLPEAGLPNWDEGVAFAAAMQTRNAWLNNEPTSKATWVHEVNSDSWMWFTTVNGVPNQFEFTTANCQAAPATAAPPTTTPAAPNCMSALNAFGVTCTANEDCCGAGTMTPQCIAKGSGKQCCRHFLSATACNASQTCCGMLGVGASSFAFCCNAGSTCCQAQSGHDVSTCCPTGTTCCQGSTVGLCCAADEVCQANMNSCVKGSTAAPTPAPAVDLNRGCISNNGWFYELRSDPSGTTLDRYQGETFVDRQTYAAFHRPAAGTVTWDEGVAFAAAMQTRNAWLNTEQTSAATWFEDSVTGNDRFTWFTTVNGAPTEFIFATEACPPLA